MTISLIAAMDRNSVIGLNNRLPWRLPADLKHFKNTTMGCPVIMGRKTHESIAQPLPGRVNVVLTRQKDYFAAGCRMATSVEEALSMTPDAKEIFIIGGASIFERTLPLANRLYITIIEHEFEGDAFFPEIDPRIWIEKERKRFEVDQDHPYAFSFLIFERVSAR